MHHVVATGQPATEYLPGYLGLCEDIWVILLKPGHYCDIEVENLKFDIFYFLYCR